MSDRKRRKAGIKAKQATMRRAREAAAESSGRETAGLDEVLHEKGQMAEATPAKETVQAALVRAEESGIELDPRIVKLFSDFKRYRVIVIALFVVAFGLSLLAMGLFGNGAIDEEGQNRLLIAAGIVTVLFVVIVVGRVRPLREDINAWNKVNELALAQSKGAHGATEADIDKIFYQRSRNRRVPPTKEFAGIRRVWYALMIAGSILIIVALLLARSSGGDVTVPVVVILVSFALLLAAAIVERTKMKPLREAWQIELDRKVRAAEKSERKARR